MNAENNTNNPSSKDAPLKGIHVLVVDDSKINLMVAEKLLLHGGAIVTVDSDGSTAVEWLKQNPNKVDLVLLDVNMPIMDGLTAVKLIREDERIRHLPVIAMTAADTEEEKSHALACGMTDHVIKPFNYNTLIPVLLKYLSRTESTSGHFLDQADTMAQKDWPVIEGIDKKQAINSYLGDKDSFLRQLRRLLSEFQFLERPAPTPTQPQEWYQIAMQMHKLVGNAALLGAHNLSQAAKQAEALAKKCDLTGLTPAMKQVTDTFISLRVASSGVLILSRPTSDQPATPDLPVDFAIIRSWLSDIEEQKFSAIRQFSDLKREIGKLCTPQEMLKIEEALDDLEFDDVLDILQPKMSTAQNTAAAR